MNEQTLPRTVDLEVRIPGATRGPLARRVRFTLNEEGRWVSAPITVARLGAGRTTYARRITLADRSEHPRFDPVRDLGVVVRERRARIVEWIDPNGSIGFAVTAKLDNDIDTPVVATPAIATPTIATVSPQPRPNDRQVAPRVTRPVETLSAPPVTPTASASAGWSAPVAQKIAAQAGARRPLRLAPNLAADLARAASRDGKGDDRQAERAFEFRVKTLLAELRAAADGGDGSFVWVAATNALPDHPTIFALGSATVIDVVLATEYATG